MRPIRSIAQLPSPEAPSRVEMNPTGLPSSSPPVLLPIESEATGASSPAAFAASADDSLFVSAPPITSDGSAALDLCFYKRGVNAEADLHVYERATRCVRVLSIYFYGQPLRLFSVLTQSGAAPICVAHGGELLLQMERLTIGRHVDYPHMFEDLETPSEIALLHIAGASGPHATTTALTLQGVGRLCRHPLMQPLDELRSFLTCSVMPRMLEMMDPRGTPQIAVRLPDDLAAGTAAPSQFDALPSVWRRGATEAALSSDVVFPLTTALMRSRAYNIFASKWQPRGYEMSVIEPSYFQSTKIRAAFDKNELSLLAHYLLRITLVYPLREMAFQRANAFMSLSALDKNPPSSLWSCLCGRVTWTDRSNAARHIKKAHSVEHLLSRQLISVAEQALANGAPAAASSSAAAAAAAFASQSQQDHSNSLSMPPSPLPDENASPPNSVSSAAATMVLGGLGDAVGVGTDGTGPPSHLVPVQPGDPLQLSASSEQHLHSATMYTRAATAASAAETKEADPTLEPTGVKCRDCRRDLLIGEVWFRCRQCEPHLDLCFDCRKKSTHADDVDGHSFMRAVSERRRNALKEQQRIQREQQQQMEQQRMEAEAEAPLSVTESEGEAKYDSDGPGHGNFTGARAAYKRGEPYVPASSAAAAAAAPNARQRQQAREQTHADSDSDYQDHADDEADEVDADNEEHISDNEADGDSDGDYVARERRPRDNGRGHTCSHTCGCLDLRSGTIQPHPKVCAGSRTLVWRHEARTAVHPNHDDATCPIRFDQGLMRVEAKSAADAAAAAAPSSASAAAAAAPSSASAAEAAAATAAGPHAPWKCPHSCGCYVHAEGKYVTHRIITWSNRSKHMASAYVHTRCGPGCPEYKDDPPSGSSAAAAAAAPLPAAETPADRKAVVQCPHTCGCFMIHHTDSADKTIRYGAFVRQSMQRDRLKASHLHNINCHPRHAGSGCPVAMPTERVRFTAIERPPIKSRPAPTPVNSPSVHISDEIEVISDSDDSDEPLVADSDRVLRQPTQPRQSVAEHAHIATFDATGCDVKMMKMRLYGGSILRVYSVRERATGNVRGIFVRKGEIGKWWAPDNKVPGAVFEQFSVPTESNRLKVPDQIRGPPAVLTPLGVYRMQTKIRRSQGSVPKRNFVLAKLLPALRSLAPNVAHHRSVVAALDASIIVPGESESAIPAPARRPSPAIDKVACRHSCGCVHRGHAGMTVFHKMISVQHTTEHEESSTCHPMCGSACAYHAVDAAAASSTSSSPSSSAAVAAAAASPAPNADRVFWRQFKLADLRDWGRDFDGSAEVADDLSVTKEELIDVFIELEVPKPGSRGQPTMEDHIREFRARSTSADLDLADRQARARDVLERTQKRQAAHAAALLGSPDPKKQRLDQPAAAAAASSHTPQSMYQPSGYPFSGMPAAPPIPSSMHYAMPPPGLSQQALAAFFEYRAQLSQPMPASSFSAAPQPPMPMQGVVMQGAESAAPDASLCIVCSDNKRSVVFPGCNHFVCCRDCAEEIRRSTRRECPLCRTKFGFKTMITGVKF